MVFETTIIGALIFIALVKYSQHTTELSLNKRWKLVNYIKEINQDTEYCSEFKLLLNRMFLDSANKNLVPKMVIFMIYYLFKKDEFEKLGKDFNKKILQSEKEHKAYKKALNIMFEINFLSSPHWYLFLIFIAMIAFVFVKITKIMQGTALEKTVYVGLSPRI